MKNRTGHSSRNYRCDLFHQEIAPPDARSGLSRKLLRPLCKQKTFMRPPLLNLRGEEDAALYQAEFDRLYHTEAIYDVLGNKVLFEPNRCEHVCLKSSDEVWNKGPREQWSQERAERIRWILPTLCSPYEVRPDRQLKPGDKTKTRIYLLRMDADPETEAPQEYYCAYTLVENKSLVRFQTAYPITREKWNNLRKKGPCYYPKS